MARVARMDRRIVILLRLAATRDGFGVNQPGRTVGLWQWAEKLDRRGSVEVAGDTNRVYQFTEATYRVRYLAELLNTDAARFTIAERIDGDEADFLRVAAIAEDTDMGRRRFLTLTGVRGIASDYAVDLSGRILDGRRSNAVVQDADGNNISLILGQAA